MDGKIITRKEKSEGEEDGEEDEKEETEVE